MHDAVGGLLTHVEERVQAERRADSGAAGLDWDTTFPVEVAVRTASADTQGGSR
jgi:hypothetical protein